ncbi:MAG: PEP/pyruvate-binding domain-containing protein [Verrucomicrobiota bacterium]
MIFRCGDSLHGSLDGLGGKAKALARLQDAGFAVPAFFVAFPDADAAEIEKAHHELCDGEQGVAVRSSARGEDGMEHSFAGQFDTFLEVERAAVVARCQDVWASGSSDRVAAYEGEQGAVSERPAALVQRMISADAAGVAFSADPVTGRRSIAVVAAVRGLGEKLVSGESDAETWEVGVGASPPRRVEEMEVSVLTSEEASKVADLGRACEEWFGHPQDIEWAFERGKIWLLQSRPITSLRGLPDPDQPIRIWDNSNIAESYPGVSSPLTYTFARRAYEHVYRQFCLLMAVPRRRVESEQATFQSMIGLIEGRIYYNLVSWYRVLAMLPGFALNRPFMEQMMGVKQPMPDSVVEEIEADFRTGKLADSLRLLRTLAGLMRQHAGLQRSVDRFLSRLRTELGNPPEGRDEYAWLKHYRELEEKLLEKWDAPLVNDFFAMLFSGVLRKLSAKWARDEHGDLANQLLGDLGDIVSAEPARRIRMMAERKAEGLPIEEEFAAYLEAFGDRCFEELKLESPTLEDDPEPLETSIEAFAERIRKGKHIVEAPTQPPEIPRMGWFRRMIFRFVLEEARRCLRNRENLRFERTRVFGRVRRILRMVGERLVERGIVEERDDIFSFQLEEILAHYEQTSAQPLSKELVRFRKEQWDEYRRNNAPPDRFQTFGPPGSYEEYEDLTESRGMEGAGDLRGIGACGGVVQGRVRVVENPRECRLEAGEILVALQTDPGWVVLFPSASGLLVERGSLLSHSAIVAREMGIPAIVSIPSVTKRLVTGQLVEMNGTTGDIRILGSEEDIL